MTQVLSKELSHEDKDRHAGKPRAANRAKQAHEELHVAAKIVVHGVGRQQAEQDGRS